MRDAGRRVSRGAGSHRDSPSHPVPPTTVYKLGGSLLLLPDLGRRLRSVIAQRSDSRPLLVVGGGPAADIVREWDRVHQLGEECAHRLALASMTLNETLVLELLPESRSVTTRQAAETAWNAACIPLLRVQGFVNADETDETAKSGGDEEWRSGQSPHLSSPTSLIPPLPHTWDVTSDSIAAWFALHWPAEELVLLKSCSLPEGMRRGGDDELRSGEAAHPLIPSSAHACLKPAGRQRRLLHPRESADLDGSMIPLPRPMVDPYFRRLAPGLKQVSWVNLRDDPSRLEPWPVLPSG